MRNFLSRLIGVALVLFYGALAACAWDYEGHRVVNQLAVASLPKDFPTFVKTPEARERIAFLSGEPDRWRNSTDLTFKHCNGPDHYFDTEELADFKLTPQTASPFRYEFIAQMVKAREVNPAGFAPVDPAKNADRTRGLPGFLPWAINEYYSKLKSGFSYLRALERHGGTPEEIRNAQENVIYIMGVMGHYVGDGSQPLHTTKHHNGWVGENPNKYSTSKTLHSWIDGGFIARAGITTNILWSRVQPAANLSSKAGGASTNLFPVAMEYLLDGFKLVEPLYELDRDGKLSGKNPSPEGREFISKQLLVAGQMLGSLWLTAYQEAPEDTWLKNALNKRTARQTQQTQE